MIPPFDMDGLLPPGVHSAEWEEFQERFGTTSHRRFLLGGLQRALYALREAGCQTVYVDGSFVTAKERPGDFDACWSVDHVDLNLLDPVLMNFDHGRVAQKTKYYGELFPAEISADSIGTVFFDFFQTDKETGRAKGIVRLDLRRLP